MPHVFAFYMHTRSTFNIALALMACALSFVGRGQGFKTTSPADSLTRKKNLALPYHQWNFINLKDWRRTKFVIVRSMKQGDNAHLAPSISRWDSRHPWFSPHVLLATLFWLVFKLAICKQKRQDMSISNLCTWTTLAITMVQCLLFFITRRHYDRGVHFFWLQGGTTAGEYIWWLGGAGVEGAGRGGGGRGLQGIPKGQINRTLTPSRRLRTHLEDCELESHRQRLRTHLEDCPTNSNEPKSEFKIPPKAGFEPTTLCLGALLTY